MDDLKARTAIACGLAHLYFKMKREKRERELYENTMKGIRKAIELKQIEDKKRERTMRNCNKKRNRRKCWMSEVHKARTREVLEEKFNQLINEPSGTLCCMAYSDFELLLCNIMPMISKKDTCFREAIPAKIRLAVTLRFLSTGESYKSLHMHFHMSAQTISKFIPEVCRAIIELLKDNIKMPTTVEEWMAIERGYSSNFPHCVGSLVGKYIVTSRLGSTLDSQKEKKAYSVLIALIDSDYKFIFAKILKQEMPDEGEVFDNPALIYSISRNKLNFPPACPLPGSDMDVPYFFIADGLFPLTNHVMKPYPGIHNATSRKGIFNKCLNRSRLVVENTLGALSSVFGILRRPIDLDLDTVSVIVSTCILLHNYLRKSKNSVESYSPPGTFDEYNMEDDIIMPGSWREHENDYSIFRDPPYMSQKCTLDAAMVREEYASYFYKKMS